MTSSFPAPAMPAVRVLVVDDDPGIRRGLGRVLQSCGFKVESQEDGEAALGLLAGMSFDVMLADLRMPKMNGMELLERVKELHPEIEVVMMTAHAEISTAVEAVRKGAFHFLLKMPSNEEVRHVVEMAAEHKQLVRRTRDLEARLGEQEAVGGLVGSSAPMQEVYRLALGVAKASSTVLILGENGTGKELVAKAIQRHGARADKPFLTLNCGAIPETLVESELFGSVKGGYTGALDKPGVFELADRGTLFLDEIGDLPLASQVKLLRALSEGEVKRVGATEPKFVDVRVLAATNVDLKERIATGRFREDLFYRLNVIPIRLPALRQRKDDIPTLAYHFLRKHATRAGRTMKGISVEALRRLRDQPWPGNVRELENAIEHAVVMARGDTITPIDLPFVRAKAQGDGSEASPARASFPSELSDLPYADAKDRALELFEKDYIELLMKRAGGNNSEAARQAGMDRSNFRRLLKKIRGKSDGKPGTADLPDGDED